MCMHLCTGIFCGSERRVVRRRSIRRDGSVSARSSRSRSRSTPRSRPASPTPTPVESVSQSTVGPRNNDLPWLQFSTAAMMGGAKFHGSIGESIMAATSMVGHIDTLLADQVTHKDKGHRAGMDMAQHMARRLLTQRDRSLALAEAMQAMTTKL